MAVSPPLSTLFALPVSARAPIYNLEPDPVVPTIDLFLSLSEYVPPATFGEGPLVLRADDPIPPSMLRRSRQIRDGGAFSYVSPLPTSFPYDIRELGDSTEEAPTATAATIEIALAKLEPSLQHPLTPIGTDPLRPTAFTSPTRTSVLPQPTLLSFSRRCAEMLLPQLDVGDAKSVVMNGPGSSEDVKKREELVEVLSGRTVLARPPNPSGETTEEKFGFAPYSLCYAGHQFGHFAGQLGDGRAISIFSTPATEAVREATGMEVIELQLKGAGRTPYSRFADGLAVLRSSVREYLGAETMAALDLPTSRCLALVGIAATNVRRERMEGAAIATRISDSWIRIGSFEILSFRGELESLRRLNLHASQVLGLAKAPASTATTPAGGPERLSLAYAVLKESAILNAKMAAGFQAYGFMHGVLNTDNISLNGRCIDYGPYAFMDVFDPHHICNHSDEEGRYSYQKQPEMIFFAIKKLSASLAPLIGCELSLASPSTSGYISAPPRWSDVDAGTMSKWTELGEVEALKIKAIYDAELVREYQRLMIFGRFGLLTSDKGDALLSAAFLDLLSNHGIDFTNSFRLLSQFTSVDASHFPGFLDLLLPAQFVSAERKPSAKEEWKFWFTSYAARLALPEEVKAAGAKGVEGRAARLNGANPRFTLRQWVLEDAIAKVDSKTPDLKNLDLVLEMASEPFKSYGEVILGAEKTEGSEREIELCSVGKPDFLGFQCSCSS